MRRCWLIWTIPSGWPTPSWWGQLASYLEQRQFDIFAGCQIVFYKPVHVMHWGLYPHFLIRKTAPPELHRKSKKQLLFIAETAAHESGPSQQTWNIRGRSFGDKKYLRRLLILNKIENHENHLFHTLLHIKTYHDYCFTSYEKMTKLHIKPVKL